VAVSRVGTDPDYFGSGLLENFIAVPESAGFGGTTGRIIFGVEIKDDSLLALEVAKADRLPDWSGRVKSGASSPISILLVALSTIDIVRFLSKLGILSV
jgi:hypothetical protein